MTNNIRWGPPHAQSAAARLRAPHVGDRNNIYSHSWQCSHLQFRPASVRHHKPSARLMNFTKPWRLETGQTRLGIENWRRICHHAGAPPLPILSNRGAFHFLSRSCRAIFRRCRRQNIATRRGATMGNANSAQAVCGVTKNSLVLGF
jgi:hypothetical protein